MFQYCSREDGGKVEPVDHHVAEAIGLPELSCGHSPSAIAVICFHRNRDVAVGAVVHEERHWRPNADRDRRPRR